MTPRKPSQRNKDTQKRRVAEADTLFSKIIRSVGYCEIQGCGSTEWLQCAHGFSRRYRSIRWDERNGFCACRSHHVYFTHRPLEWDSWLRGQWDPDVYAQLRHLAVNAPNPDVKELLPVLRSRWADIEEAAA